MKRVLKVFPFAWLAFGLLLVVCRQPPGPILPQKIAPYHENIYLNGRFDTADTAGPVCAWTGSEVIIRFRGSSVNALVRDQGRDDNRRWQGQHNYLNVVLDDSVVQVIALFPDSVRYRVATALKDTIHILRLFKRSEASIGPVQFLGFELDAAAALLPPPPLPGRRLELVGNSITCGYGNECQSHRDPFLPATENGYLAYGALSARALSAEYRAVCWSGKGMYRNIDLTRQELIPHVYGRTLPADTASQWDFSRWIPNAVVINLGTNDFNKGNPTEEQFGGAYRSFVQRLRGYYPQAVIFCVVGTMMSDGWPQGNEALSTTRRYLTNMIKNLRAAGEQRVHYVELEPQKSENGTGAHYHPNLITHRLMAEHLTRELQRVLGW